MNDLQALVLLAMLVGYAPHVVSSLKARYLRNRRHYRGYAPKES